MRSHIEIAGNIRVKGHAEWPEGLIGRDLEAYALVLLEAGAGYYWDESLETGIEVQAGDILVLFPGLRHRYGRRKQDPLWSERYLVFNGPIFKELERDGLINRNQPVLHTHNDNDYRLAFARLVNDVLAGHQHIYPHQMLGQMHQLIIQANSLHHQHLQRQLDWREQACAALGEQLQHEISLQRIAEQCGCSEQTFRKRFRKELGLAPQQFRLQRRLDHAQELLMDSHYNLSDIADACGFCDQYQFSRMFKRHRGKSPGTFRKEQGLSPRTPSARA